MQALKENRGLKDSAYGLNKKRTKTTNKTQVFFKGLCLAFHYELKEKLLEWLQPASCSVGISYTPGKHREQ